MRFSILWISHLLIRQEWKPRLSPLRDFWLAFLLWFDSAWAYFTLYINKGLSWSHLPLLGRNFSSRYHHTCPSLSVTLSTRRSMWLRYFHNLFGFGNWKKEWAFAMSGRRLFMHMRTASYSVMVFILSNRKVLLSAVNLRFRFCEHGIELSFFLIAPHVPYASFISS